MITRGDIALRLNYGVKRGFLNGMKDFTPLRSAFVQEVPSGGASETYADLGDMPWPVEESAAPGDGGVDATGHAQVTGGLSHGTPGQTVGQEERGIVVYNRDYVIRIKIEHNAINDDRSGDLEAEAADAGRNFQKYMDQLAFTMLNTGAAATNGKCYDGLVFFSASHVDPRATYTTVQSNVNTSALTLDAYDTVRVAAAGFRDSRGNTAGYDHNLLIVSQNLRRTGHQIASNPEDYATGNQALNPYSPQLLVAPANWLDSTAWFVVDASMSRKPILLQMRQAPEVTITDDEAAPGGGVRLYKIHARFALAYGDWRLCAQGNT